jgi:hypothetical protein
VVSYNLETLPWGEEENKFHGYAKSKRRKPESARVFQNHWRRLGRRRYGECAQDKGTYDGGADLGFHFG